MTHQKRYLERLSSLRREALAISTRGGAGSDDARSRRAKSADLNTRFRFGDGLDISDGKLKVPIGAGLEIDSRGRVGSTAKLEIIIIKAPSVQVSTSYVAMGLVSAESSIGSGSISIDTANDWVRLEVGGAYSISAHVVFNQDLTGLGSASRFLYSRIDRVDDLDATSPVSSVVYSEISGRIQPGAEEEIVCTFPMSAVIDLRAETSPVAIQIMTRVSAGTHEDFVVQGNIKIERIG